LERGDLEMGHARALLSLPEDAQTEIARKVVAKSLTVRETEKMVRQKLDPKPSSNVTEIINPHVERLERHISEKIGSPTTIQQSKKGKGKLVIQYSSLDELDGILDHMGVEKL
jgi:ParB family chromosome partitioning protein